MPNDTVKFYLLRGEHVIKIKALRNSKSEHIIYSIPRIYKNQIPLFFDIKGEYKSYFIEGDEYDNNMINIEIPPLKKDDEIKIILEYEVIVKKETFKDFNKKILIPKENELPENIKIWLKPTKSIQSNSLYIKIMSKILKGFGNDLTWFVKKVVYWNAYHGLFFNTIKRVFAKYYITRKIFYSEKIWLQLEDALSTLFFGGACAGNANLIVALLRSQGVPSRVIITSPCFYGKNIWLDSQHYITDFYCPGNEWIIAEPGAVGRTLKGNIILKVVPISDEDISGDGFGEYGGMHTWFSISNKEDIVLKVPEEFKSYKINKKEKIGFPILRSWQKEILKIPSKELDKFSKIMTELWKLYLKCAGEFKVIEKTSFKNALEYQKKAIEYLETSDLKNCLEFLKDAENEYSKSIRK